MYNITLILITFLILIIRFSIIKFFPIMFEEYSEFVYLFICSFFLSMYVSGSIYLAFFASLSVFYSCLLYKYNSNNYNNDSIINTVIFIFGLLFIILSNNLLYKYSENCNFHFLIYFMIMYLAMSIGEWLIHKYLMHGYQFAPYVRNIPFIGIIDKEHQLHHHDVNKDMTITNDFNETSVIFENIHLLGIFLIAIIVSFMITFFMKLKVKIHEQLGVIIFLSLLITLIWNNIHPAMHDVVITDQSLLKAIPSCLEKIDKSNIYFKNHEMHHLVKEISKKGNFNVVFLAADDLFNTNNLFKNMDL